MSKFPRAVFPTDTREYSRDDQQMFTDYGCWESVDVEYSSEPKAHIFAKKHRSSHVASDSFSMTSADATDNRILAPVHDFLTLGKPVEIKSLIDDNINYSDLFCRKFALDQEKEKAGKKRGLRRGSYILTTPVEQYLNNLITDHPDICGRTFEQISRKRKKARDISIYKEDSLIKYSQLIDPTLCDVGRNLLRDILRKETQTELSRKYSDRDFTGGCISFKSIERRKNKQYGILVSAQGQCLDELCVKILNIDCDKKLERGESSTDGDNHLNLPPHLEVGPEICQTLNGRICQIDLAVNDDNILYGARSDYHVLLNRFNHSSTEWNNQEKGHFTSTEDIISTLGLLKSSGTNRISSIALSPFISGECIVATEDRYVRLWTPDVEKNMEGSLESLEVLLSGSGGGLSSTNSWRQVRFAAHPRQLYITDDQNVSLFDIRTQYSNVSLLNILSSKHVKQHEKIFCIESCSNIGNEYGCLIATNYNLFLMDQRFCGEPLLHWGNNMEFPPNYLRTSSVATWDQEYGVNSGSNISYSTSGIIVGNQYPQEIYSYQMCRTIQDSIHHAPQAISTPRILGSFPGVRHYFSTKPSKYNEYLENRTSKMTTGIEAISLKNEGIPGMVVLQINSVGDIGYQTQCLKNTNDVQDMSNLISGKTSATFLSEREENERQYLERLKIENYDQWAERVTNIPLSTDNTNKGVSISNRYYSSHTKSPVSSKFFSKLLCPAATKDKPSKNCALCSTYSAENDQILDTEKCQKCRTETRGVLNILETLKSRMIFTHSAVGKVGFEDNHNPESLSLIDLVKTGDDHDNELGKLLKATWKTSYKKYWETLREEEQRRQLNEKSEQERSTFDLITNINQGESSNDINTLNLNKESPHKRKRTSTHSNSQPTRSVLSWLSAPQERGPFDTVNILSNSQSPATLPLPNPSVFDSAESQIVTPILGESGSILTPNISLASPLKRFAPSSPFFFLTPKK